MHSENVWKIVIAAGLFAAVIIHALFPRYEWRTFGDDGTTIVVYDRWANYFQRATYDEQGKVKPGEPFKPF